MVIAEHATIDWKAVEVLEETLRGAGGFGHTGKNNGTIKKRNRRMNNKCTKNQCPFFCFSFVFSKQYGRKKRRSMNLLHPHSFFKDEFNYFFVEAIRQKNAEISPKHRSLHKGL